MQFLRHCAALCSPAILTIAVACSFPTLCDAELVRVDVVLDAAAADRESYEGQLYVFVTRGLGEPRSSLNWFSPQPFFRVDVSDFRPGQTCIVDEQAAAFPAPLPQLPPGFYRAQAVLHQDFASPHPERGTNNLHSDAVSITVEQNKPQSLKLVLSRKNDPPAPPTQDWIHQVRLKSELLSQFHGREVEHEVAVVLPAEYDADPARRFPVAYNFPGFGASPLDMIRRIATPPIAGPGEAAFIRAYCSGNCRWGHHAFADSETNGPRQQAFLQELIPAIDATFRTVPQPHARFLTGHSSGGWSSLWLQVCAPEMFGGVWSIAPDPVDFRDFQQIDIYAQPPQNMYVDASGAKRPLARMNDRTVLWFDSFVHFDDTLGRGGQMRSFEAVFSPLSADGEPMRLWDRQTGEIDPAVAQAWQAYDIRLTIERNWERLAPLLAGKLHIVVGSEDTFYLEGAVEKLAESLTRLGSDADVPFLPGRDHSDVLSVDLQRRIRQEMSAAFLNGEQQTVEELLPAPAIVPAESR